MDSYEFLKERKEDFLRRQRKELAKRIADTLLGEATESQIERVYWVIFNFGLDKREASK